MDDQVFGHTIDQMRAGSSCHGMEIVNEGLDQRPQVNVTALQLDSRLCLEVRVFLEDLAESATDAPRYVATF